VRKLLFVVDTKDSQDQTDSSDEENVENVSTTPAVGIKSFLKFAARGKNKTLGNNYERVARDSNSAVQFVYRAY